MVSKRITISRQHSYRLLLLVFHMQFCLKTPKWHYYYYYYYHESCFSPKPGLFEPRQASAGPADTPGRYTRTTVDAVVVGVVGVVGVVVVVVVVI